MSDVISEALLISSYGAFCFQDGKVLKNPQQVCEQKLCNCCEMEREQIG